MSKFVVRGGNAVYGEININGAKNSALPILCASILNSGLTILNNVPILSDTKISIEILKMLGCKVAVYKNTVVIDSSFLNKSSIDESLTKKMRSSIIFLGALLSRLKEAQIAYPGGCCLGARPIDLHLEALKKLNVEIDEADGLISAKTKKIIGTEINLKYPSVGATQNIILASVLGDGVTIINNAAKEPEIFDLQCFLNKMGAKVSGCGQSSIKIVGVKSLNDVEFTIMPDRIECGTYMCLTAVTGGEVILNNANAEHVRSITNILTEMGNDILICNDKIIIKSNRKNKAIPKIITKPYPDFPTDMQAQIMAVLVTATGKSCIEETVFEARNKHAFELNKMGADIKVLNGNIFQINGVDKLNASEVTAYDLRGGAAMIIASLGCDGESVIYGAEHILRGYENITGVINSIGGKIKFE